MSDGVGSRERDYLKQLASGTTSPETIQAVLADRRARRFHSVRRALAAHPRTPRSEALALVATLFWRDLAAISCDARVHPEVRRAVDREILRRLADMALAERVDLARCAGRGVIAVLRFDSEPRVIQALLSNRLVIESDVVLAASNPRALAGALEVIGSDPRWTLRPEVRSAVVRNPGTPLPVSLSLVSGLALVDLLMVADSSALPVLLRECAARLIALRRPVDWPASGK
jgi:hypothetical protein